MPIDSQTRHQRNSNALRSERLSSSSGCRRLAAGSLSLPELGSAARVPAAFIPQLLADLALHSEAISPAMGDVTAAGGHPHVKMLTPPGPTSSPTMISTAPQSGCPRNKGDDAGETSTTAMIHSNRANSRFSFDR